MSGGQKFGLTAETLRGLLSYDPLTGEFRWKANRGGTAKVGAIAGTTSTNGHRQIKIGGHAYQAHQLAWLYMTGQWAESIIDHRDTDPDNNRWGNLRLATQMDNCANRRRHSNNHSGLKGASWHGASGRWAATICRDYKKRHLGLFDTAAEAHAAYVTASLALFGEFARAP